MKGFAQEKDLGLPHVLGCLKDFILFLRAIDQVKVLTQKQEVLPVSWKLRGEGAGQQAC